MARNNDVYSVLVTQGNQAVLAAGNKVTALLPGQIGVFDANTNLSIAAAGAPSVRNYYIAVGVDTNGDSATDEVVKSGGNLIQKANLKYYTYRPHTPGQTMKVKLSNYTADCETEYGIKLEMRNQEIYRTQGYNQFTHTYSIVTSCCTGCDPTCPSGDANEITRLLIANINSDPNGLVVARALARQALVAADIPGLSGDIAAGAVVSDANILAVMAFNATQADPADYLYTDLEIETVTQSLRNFNGSINMNYFWPRETVVIATKIEGFKCNGTLAVTQQAVFEEGSGYDLKQKEYIAKGWKEGPYRVSTLNGVADDRYFITNINTKYDVFALSYDQHSRGAWLYYDNPEATLIGIPTTDATTRAALVAILDALAPPGFDPLADDAAASIASITTIEKTENKTTATDGIA